jgi:hypothetical protein
MDFGGKEGIWIRDEGVLEEFFIVAGYDFMGFWV